MGRQRRQDGAGVHLVVGGYPPGEPAGHDMDLARRPPPRACCAPTGVAYDRGERLRRPRALARSQPTAGDLRGRPFPDETRNDQLGGMAVAGGRWLALHGTSGGKAVRVPAGRAGGPGG